MKIMSLLMKVLNNFSDAMEKRSIESTSEPSRKTYLPIIDALNPPRDTVIVTDVSLSMQDSDYFPTRLRGGIEAGIEYVNARKNPQDRIALVSFSDSAKIDLPLLSVTNKQGIVRALQDFWTGGGTDIEKGLQAAIDIFSREKLNSQRYVILLTDGYGGYPFATAGELKEQYGVVIEVIGIGGSPNAVNESLLRRVATTDRNGFTHYRFIKDSAGLKKHYKQLATGLVWNGDRG